MSLAQSIAMLIGDETDGVEGLVYDETGQANVFVGYLPQRPNRCVAVIPTGGFESDSKLPYDNPSIQILVRGDEDPRWALDTAGAVYSLLQGKRNQDLPDGTRLISLIAIQSGPAHVGKDDNGRFQYAMNYQGEVRNPTSERTKNE